MTDGTTGFHVAPIKEDDMRLVQDILKRAADAIVGMSQLTADVDMLRNTVAGLQADTERLRNQNNALDEALNYSRKQRDEQAAQIENLHRESANSHIAEIEATERANKLEMDLGQAQIDLDLTRKAKDDAEFKALELEDKLTQAEAKLAKVAELHKAIFAEPTPEPTKPSPEPEAPSLSSILGPSGPVLTYAPDSLSEWEPGYNWDHDTQCYWREGVTPKHGGANF